MIYRLPKEVLKLAISYLEIHYWILLQNFHLINMFANSTDIMRQYPFLDVDQIVYFSQTFQTYQKQKNSDEHSRKMESRYLRMKTKMRRNTATMICYFIPHLYKTWHKICKDHEL